MLQAPQVQSSGDGNCAYAICKLGGVTQGVVECACLCNTKLLADFGRRLFRSIGYFDDLNPRYGLKLGDVMQLCVAPRACKTTRVLFKEFSICGVLSCARCTSFYNHVLYNHVIKPWNTMITPAHRSHRRGSCRALELLTFQPCPSCIVTKALQGAIPH